MKKTEFKKFYGNFRKNGGNKPSMCEACYASIEWYNCEEDGCRFHAIPLVGVGWIKEMETEK